MKILLIVSLYPPVRHTGALRWTRLCRRLLNKGCEFQVITTTPGFWSPDQEDADVLKDVNTTRIDYPSNFVMGYMKGWMWLVKKLGSKFHSVNQSGKKPVNGKKEDKSLSLKSIVKKTIKNVVKLPQRMINRLAFPHHSKYWARSVVKHCLKTYEAKDFDIIIASHPYAGTLIAAEEISDSWGVPWVADFRDPWTHDMQSPLRGNSRMLNKLWEFERKTLESASAVVSINRQMCEYINSQSTKTQVITNSYEPGDYTYEKNELETGDADELVLCYTGNIAEDHEYRLFLDGLRLLQDEGVRAVKLNYYGGAFHRLENYANEIDLSTDYLIDHGMVKHEEANQSLANADCGLVFGWCGSLARLVSTGKIFDSLGVGSPIIGICAVPDSGMEDIIINSGSGVVLNNPKKIAETIIGAIAAKKNDQLDTFMSPSCSEDGWKQYTTEQTAEEYLKLLQSLVI